MLRRLREPGQIEIGKYPETTSPETLYRHHRIARILSCSWVVAGALMASSLFEFLFGPRGWTRTLAMITLAASCTAALLSAMPGVCSRLWISSIDSALRARGLPIPEEEKQVDRGVASNAMKMAYWFAAAVVGASLVHTGIVSR